MKDDVILPGILFSACVNRKIYSSASLLHLWNIQKVDFNPIELSLFCVLC